MAGKTFWTAQMIEHFAPNLWKEHLLIRYQSWREITYQINDLIDDNTGVKCCWFRLLRGNLWSSHFVTVSQFVTETSQFVTGGAICDGKCRNLWQRQNMQFNYIYSLNFDKYFVLSSYLF